MMHISYKIWHWYSIQSKFLTQIIHIQNIVEIQHAIQTDTWINPVIPHELSSWHIIILKHWVVCLSIINTETELFCLTLCFPDDTFLNENVWISIEISLKFVPKGPINNIPAMVQIMAWCRPGDKPLSEPMVVSLLMHICVIQPQWVNCNLQLHYISLSCNIQKAWNAHGIMKSIHLLLKCSFCSKIIDTDDEYYQYNVIQIRRPFNHRPLKRLLKSCLLKYFIDWKYLNYNWNFIAIIWFLFYCYSMIHCCDPI